ncbi:MAG: efflux transporter outer membrane subunit [Planctomycetes bacterium]|nr:efflux transporter outer membrane subunit [Planctomycetota bacterium]
MAALLLAACKAGPDYARPDVAARTDAAWREPAGAAVNSERIALARWWEKFGSPELSGLATQLVSQNLSLAQARQRVVTSRARRGIADAARLPQLNGGASYTRAGTGNESLNFQGPPPGQDVDVYSASMTAGWELDLWGRVARLVEAADAQIDVAVEDYRDAAVSLLAELALAYVDANTLHQRIDVLGRNVELLEQTLRLAQSRLDAGLGARIDVEQAQRELESTRARLPELQQALAQAENRIAVLVGERPRDEFVHAADALSLPPAVGLGLPADLLARRADVRRSERRLAAASASLGASEAERYPSIWISGTLALRARDFDTLGSGAPALSYSVGPGLSVPLFSGGRIQSDIATSRSELETARIDFERALLTAVGEVESSASGVVHTRERAQRLEAAATSARKTVELAQELYQSGSRSLLQLVDAQRALVSSEDALLLARQAALAQTITLYRALGGGFEPIELDGTLRPTDSTESTR